MRAYVAHEAWPQWLYGAVCGARCCERCVSSVAGTMDVITAIIK